MACDYSFDHYKESLEDAQKKGYQFFTFAQRDLSLPMSKVIFLRHDVDFNLSNALKIAKLEHQLGIKATYFIRVHGTYNPFFLKNYKMIKEILAMGHEIGLHYSPDFALNVGEDLEESFRRDRTVLENILNEKIKGVAMHELGNSKFKITDEDLVRFQLEYQAYSPLFIKHMKYISESSGRWREGCMCSFIAQEVSRLIILTHPLWWWEKTPLENY